ncbi:MAG: proline dehydrogenase family protein [Methanomicrobiales archaeon]
MDTSRWILPDLASALAWARERNGQGIRCALALAGEFARTPVQAGSAADGNLRCIAGIAVAGLDASLSVKPSALGGLFDPEACRGHATGLAREAARSGVPLELDMEGRNSVDSTLDIAAGCRRENPRVMVALQAYLDRTPGDIRNMVSLGIGVRLVKGAYLGDVSDYRQVRGRMKECAGILQDLGASFSLGTHDPVLIGWAMEEFADGKDLVEFGFLKGLSDETKIRLASGGWRVSEYVPYGRGEEGYVTRRERYLANLAGAGLAPAP